MRPSVNLHMAMHVERRDAAAATYHRAAPEIPDGAGLLAAVMDATPAAVCGRRVYTGVT